MRPATWFTAAPRGYSHVEAATLTTAGLTAWRALVGDGGLEAGDTVLCLGTGGVSVFGLQIAKAMGAVVILTSSSDEKLEKGRALGADHVINYRSVPEWGARVRELTSGRGVDHVLEVGGPGTLPQSITAVRVGGHISLIGVLTGIAGPVPTATLMRKQVRLQGLIVGSRRQQQALVRALETTGIKPVIDKAFPLERLADAFRHEESGRHFGKIGVEIDARGPDHTAGNVTMLRLYDYLPRATATRCACCDELGLPFERVELDIMKGETRTPGFLAEPQWPHSGAPAARPAAARRVERDPVLSRRRHAVSPERSVSSGRRRCSGCSSSNTATSPTSPWPLLHLLRRAVRARPAPRPTSDRQRGAGRDGGPPASRALLRRRRYTIADLALYAYTHAADEGGFDLSPYPAIRAWLARLAAEPGHVPITAG